MWPVVPFVVPPPTSPLPAPPPAPVAVVADVDFDEPPPQWVSVRPRPKLTRGDVAVGALTTAAIGVVTFSLAQRQVEPVGR
jgi:hypothetical protein